VFAYLAADAGVDAGYAVVTDRFVCLLGPGTSPDATRALYAALETGAESIDDVLDAIVARHGIEHFGIVEMVDAADRSMNIAVRGGVTVNLDGSTTTRLSGPTGATWMAGEARGVTSLSLAIDTGAAGGESLPIRRGVVRAHSLLIDEGATDAATPIIAEEPTLLTVPIDLSRVREAARAVEASPLRVRLPDGNEFDAVIPIVLGRRPWSADSDTSSAVHVSVPSPLREVSATHLEVAEVDGGLTARDLGSTNGTIVLSPDRAPRLLEGRRSTALVDGDVLDVGEGYRLVIVTAGR
jgi:hypothetical protein